VRPHGRLRGRPQGGEGRWDAVRALSSRPFCSCDSRWVSLRYLAAAARYTAQAREVQELHGVGLQIGKPYAGHLGCLLS
jgi:hypothetical protein